MSSESHLLDQPLLDKAVDIPPNLRRHDSPSAEAARRMRKTEVFFPFRIHLTRYDVLRADGERVYATAGARTQSSGGSACNGSAGALFGAPSPVGAVKSRRELNVFQ